MRSIEDKGCLNNGTTPHEKTNRPSHHHHHNRTALGKPTPSKWDDAQKWLVNLSRGEKNPAKASPRNSNADDLRLIARAPKKDDYSSDEEKNDDVETKNVVDNRPYTVVRPICLRDMGTEMTPIASQEPSRSATPVRVTSPVSSESSSPVRCPRDGAVGFKTGRDVETKCDEPIGANGIESNKSVEEHSGKINPSEIRAAAWEAAERAKYTARFKREELKIQAWENHQKRKAEMENRKVEVKAERMKSRAQEKYNSKLAATRRIAEEKRANAEAKLQEKAMKTSERADYIRRNGHIPFCFSFKLPSFCCC
ncbi:hypothetical protein PHJA_000979200 [Phtheirospermum japonicum]|uniref:Remorin C-terminal domain-containing protein n=1 Tax=Phtheirospermum japonicum TaxID=374723 RepID=A0A830BYM1_9LAMI|nr:hypothetical protein PHJA_000979200 [Phtheirospermum japonicum]